MGAIEDYQNAWQAANAIGDTAGMAAAHAGAESVRAASGYSGGADGSQYIPISNSSGSGSGGGSINTSILPTALDSGSSSSSSVQQQMAANSARAREIYNQTGTWNDPQIQALHNQNAQLAGNNYSYNSSTGVWTPSTKNWEINPIIPTPIVQPQQSMLQQVQSAIQNFQNTQTAPTYQQPDYSSIIPTPTQGAAITSDPSKTSFVPTSRYNDRVQSIKAQADQQSMNAYNANLSSYNANVGNQLQGLSGLMSILPYYESTAAEKAEAENVKAKAALEAQIQANKDKQWQAEYDLDKQKAATAANRSSSSSKPTATQSKNAGTSSAMQQVQAAISAGTKKSVIAKNIVAHAADYQAAGVDYNDVLEYLNQAYPSEDTTTTSNTAAYNPNSFLNTLLSK